MDSKRTVRDGYDTIAADYTEARTDGGHGAALAADLANDLAPGACVLDAGCGSDGPATVELDADHEVVGLDISEGQLEHLERSLPTVAPAQGDLTRLPFADGAFDGLVSSHTVIHIPREQHASVFSEFRRVLRRDGEALVVVGSEPWEGHTPDWLGMGEEMFWSFYGAERNLELLRAAGFSVERTELVDDELGGEFLFVRVVA